MFRRRTKLRFVVFMAAFFPVASLMADVLSPTTTGDLLTMPSAVADNVETLKNVSITIDVLANDLGDGLILQAPNVWSFKGGNVALVDSQLAYTPKNNFVGEDKIWYLFNDSQGRRNYGEVTINVTEENLRPKSYPDSVDVIGYENIKIDVLANDQGSNLTLRAPDVWSLKGGNVALVDNQLSYTPKENFVGEDKIWYYMSDPQGRSSYGEVTITVTAQYSLPQGAPDFVTTVVNETVTIDVLANDQGHNLTLNAPHVWSLKGGNVALVDNQLSYASNDTFIGEDKIWYNFIDSRGASNFAAVTINVTAVGEVNAVRIPMHKEFLKDQSVVSDEVGGTQSMKVATAAWAGSYQLQVSSGFTLQDNQLITYLSTDGQYYTVATSQSSGSTVNLKTGLPAHIAEGGDVWPFYEDGSHPNIFGYYSLVDFALRNNDVSALDSGKHVMLGDSWFASPGIEERLTEKLPNAQIINEGEGGQTAADLLERFDRDVRLQNPDVVWVLVGANDFFLGVSVEDYIANMKKIIEKINAIGAKAMVFDGSVGGSYYGSDTLTIKSHQYAEALADLLNQ